MGNAMGNFFGIDRRKPFIRADMLRQLSAEKIPERAAGKARKEIACEEIRRVKQDKACARRAGIPRTVAGRQRGAEPRVR